MTDNSAFPDLLFNPIRNDFDDLYFKLDPVDYRQNAVRVDPRFTAANIRKMRGTAKTVYRYLEWTSLWDDYMAYLEDTYGSVEMAYMMYKKGILPDPFPSINHRPVLRKGKLRKLLKSGITISYVPPSISQNTTVKYLKKIADMEDFDPNEGFEFTVDDQRDSKDMKELMKKNMDRYRKQRRVEILNNGTAAIGQQIDFISDYYMNVESGMYDTQWSNHDSSTTSLSAMMKEMENRKWRSPAEIAQEKYNLTHPRYTYDSHMIRDREKAELAEIYTHLQKDTGIDIMGTLANSISKKAFKAIRSDMAALGADMGLTKGERKKLKKKQKKLDRAQNQSMRANQKLSEVLLNNKIFMNGGTIRFEDMKRFDEDDY